MALIPRPKVRAGQLIGPDQDGAPVRTSQVDLGLAAGPDQMHVRRRVIVEEDHNP